MMQKNKKKMHEVVGIINLISSLIITKLKLEFNNKDFLNKMSLLFEIINFINNIYVAFQPLINAMIQAFDFTDLVKAINLNKISLYIRFPKYQNGIALSLKIMGLSQIINYMLDDKKSLPISSFEQKIKEEEERQKKEEEELKKRREEEQKKKKEEELRKQKEDEIRKMVDLKKEKEELKKEIEKLKIEKEEFKKQKEEEKRKKEEEEKKQKDNKNLEKINTIQTNNQIDINLKKELEKYNKENKKLAEENAKLKKENIKLINDNTKLKEELETIKSNNNISDSIADLLMDIRNKEKEINELKTKLDKNYKNANYNDAMVINFVSGDGVINEGIICLKTDIFAEVEEKLYQKYEEYREKNNTFLCGGNLVLRFKKICENNIKNGDKVQLLDISLDD